MRVRLVGRYAALFAVSALGAGAALAIAWGVGTFDAPSTTGLEAELATLEAAVDQLDEAEATPDALVVQRRLIREFHNADGSVRQAKGVTVLYRIMGREQWSQWLWGSLCAQQARVGERLPDSCRGISSYQ